MAAEHLVGLGHRRIAYIGDQFGYQSDTERLAGYREALDAAGIPLLPELDGSRRRQAEAGYARNGRCWRLAIPPPRSAATTT